MEGGAERRAHSWGPAGFTRLRCRSKRVALSTKGGALRGRGAADGAEVSFGGGWVVPDLFLYAVPVPVLIIAARRWNVSILRVQVPSTSVCSGWMLVVIAVAVEAVHPG